MKNPTYAERQASRARHEVETLGLSRRAANALIRFGYLTKADLAGITREKLLEIQNLGVKSADEILVALENLNEH